MDVTLLYFDGCPSWHEADSYLRSLAQEIPDMVVRHQLVDTPKAAELHRFQGSPSFQIAGSDLFAPGAESFGLSCRIYQTPSGPAGSPTLSQLRHALNSSQAERA